MLYEVITGLRVDVDTEYLLRAELCRGDGQDARAATVVEQGYARRNVAFQPFKTETGRRVRTGAESHAGVEDEDDGLGVGRRMPRGDDPQAVSYNFV